MESFGRYELRRRLGIGGMAEVYEAIAFGEHGVEQPLVIKRILEEHSADANFQAMFVDEARVALRLNHPNIVHVFDFGKADERYFLAMEFIRGQDLAGLLAEVKKKRQLLPLEVSLFIIGEIAKGLDYAHRATAADGAPLGVVHRDVSPANVLISNEGAVKIGDFGIAKFNQRTGKTQAASVRGKVRYMSPEQVEGHALDGRSDLFSLGGILYEMLTGLHAFDGRSDLEVMTAVRKGAYRKASEIYAVPPEIEQLLGRMLAKDPAQRFARGNDVQREIERIAAKLQLRATSGAVADLLVEIFPVVARASDPNIRTRVGIRAKDVDALPETERTQIKRLKDVNGLPVFVEEKPEEKPTAGMPASVVSTTGGTIGGRYRLRDALGRGSAGVVYRATDLDIGEDIALKVMTTLDPRSGEVDRFKREIITARRITHPNVLRIYDFGTAGRDSYISMELLTGGSLGDRIEKGTVPFDEGIAIALGVCEGLNAAHEAGIVHRDLKPDNILFDGTGRPKIVDFGLARLTESSTRTVGFSGTPYYMSPEQADGVEATYQTDIYSLGVVFFEMFTGRVPFQADGLVKLALMHARQPPPRPSELRPGMLPGLEPILLRMLEKDPANRYNDVMLVAEDLIAVRDGRRQVQIVETRAEVTATGEPPSRSMARPRPTNPPMRAPAAPAPPVLRAPAPETAPRPGRGALWTVIAIVGLAIGAGALMLGKKLGTPTAAGTPTAIALASIAPIETPAPSTAPLATSAPVAVATATAPSATPGTIATPAKMASPAKTPKPTPSATRVALAPTPVKTPPPPKGLGVLNVGANPWASVYVDGRKLAKQAPFLGEPIEEGPHTIRFVNETANFDESRTVIVSTGKTTGFFVNTKTRKIETR